MYSTPPVLNNFLRHCSCLLKLTSNLGKGIVTNSLVVFVLQSFVMDFYNGSNAIDNIDYSPSATTTKDSFHDTGISLIQHPSHEFKGS